MTIEPRNERGLVVEAGGAVLGALIGICFAGPLGVGPGAAIGAGITPVMERWLGRCTEEFRRRGIVVADAAAAASHLAEDEVVQRALSGDVPQPLVARILETASRTDSNNVLRLLGAVLGEHVSERPRSVDEDVMLVDCMSGLEAGHIRMLEILEGQANPDNPNVGWTMATLTSTVDGQLSPLGLNSTVGGLLGRGLIESPSGFGGVPIYLITDFGRALLEALRWAHGTTGEWQGQFVEQKVRMSDNSPTETDTSSPPPRFQNILNRASAKGISAEAEYLENGGDGVWRLTVEMSNGPRKRRIHLRETQVRAFKKVPFEHVVFLSDYEAVADIRNGTIEARLTQLSTNSGILQGGWVRRFQRLPGVTHLGPDDDEGGEGQPGQWALDMSMGEISLRIGPISDDLATLLRRPKSMNISMRITGRAYETHDAAVKLLESIASPLFFDLDLRYNLVSGLAVNRDVILRGVRIGARSAPEFPKRTYAPEALSIYMYGRAASRLPLLEFLAYYQTLEFFFPMFSRAESVRRVRTLLNDPRFDSTSDLDLSRIVTVAASSGYVNERHQLRATVRASVGVEELREHLESDEALKKSLLTRKPIIKGVQAVTLSGDHDLRDQIADRLYAIRCRIVHTKQDGAESGVDLLLPSSEEAQSLGPDIKVARFIARQTLIATASAFRLE